MPLTNHNFKNDKFSIGYKLFLPDEYGKIENELYPIIIFLHGVKKRGNDLSLLDDYGLLRITEQKKDFSYIVLAPQCPEDSYWPNNRLAVMKLLEEFLRNYQVDHDRIYLTGFSMGGYGVWDFHGEDDDVVSISGSESMISAIVELGGSPKFTRYPGYDHDHKIMYDTYSNPELYAWFESNKRGGGKPR